MTKAKWNYIFGAVTITVIIGGTIYVIVKAKQAEKLEEEAITVEEAKEIVAKQKKFDKGEETVIFQATFDEINIPEATITPQPIARPYIKSAEEVADEIEEEEEESELVEMDEAVQDGYPQVYDDVPGPTIEPLKDFSYLKGELEQETGDSELRYHKDSDDAKHQFIRMELAEWSGQYHIPPYHILIELFDFPFVPTNNGDELLRTQIIDYRMQFFGPGSKWNREVSYADVILHYARSAAFNCGETLRYWVEYFMDFNDFVQHMTSHQVETLLLRLNSHTYFNEERQTYGLFGLTSESFEQAIRIGNGSIYRQVTYETEFQEFLKSVI